jgi:hypothetical protein
MSYCKTVTGCDHLAEFVPRRGGGQCEQQQGESRLRRRPSVSMCVAHHSQSGFLDVANLPLRRRTATDVDLLKQAPPKKKTQPNCHVSESEARRMIVHLYNQVAKYNKYSKKLEKRDTKSLCCASFRMEERS